MCTLPLDGVNLGANNFDDLSCTVIECLSENQVTFGGDAKQTQQDGFSLITGCEIIPPSLICLESDSLALVALYNATDGPNWNNDENWLNGPVFTWYGVEVANNRVTFLDLCRNELNGILPSEFYNLTAIQSVALCENNIDGQISSQIGNLNQLHHLNLTSTNFDGVLPTTIENCSNLGQLHISDCNF